MYHLEEILHEYDGPALFSFTAEGKLWAATLIEQHANGDDEVMVSPSTSDLVREVGDSHIPVAALFADPGPFYKLRIAWSSPTSFAPVGKWICMSQSEAERHRSDDHIFLHPKGRQP